MAGGQQVFTLDLGDLKRFGDQLKSGIQASINEAWKALSAWGAEYQRRVKRVTPVDTGHARQSWQLIRDKANLTVTLGNSAQNEDGVNYLKFLEYGTDRIAKGRVKAWTEGQAPVMTWPAKIEDLPQGVPAFGTKAHVRYQNVMERAFTSGAGEQMPMLRPIGYDIAPEIFQDVKTAFEKGFRAAVEEKRKGS